MSGMNTAPYQEFAREKLGFEFSDIDLLVTALTHRSYVNEHKKSAKVHNACYFVNRYGNWLESWRRVLRWNVYQFQKCSVYGVRCCRHN
jgi:hypothetical protein